MSKSVEELFKGAPEEATHYCAGAISGFWRDLSGTTWKFFRDSDRTWHDSCDKTSDLIHNSIGLKLIERPQPKPWSGPEDGLPPVGTVCEVLCNYMIGCKWAQGTIKYVSDKHIVVVDADNIEVVFKPQHLKFRTLKTPEQIASDQRETAIRELMDIAQVDCHVTAARLVDAGFKREVMMYSYQFDDLYDARQAEDDLVYAGFTVHVIRNRLGFAVFADL